ncbi:myotrophin-like [Oculina patagonica]
MGEELVWACKNGDLDQVKAIVDKPGFNIDGELLNGRNGLHFAADYGQKEVIEYLLSKGANINLPDRHGITPLLASIFESKTACVQLLLEKGANKNLKAPDGSSYFDCAETDDIKSLLK